ncbi:uncharacterized protein TM35_000301630 [Trypanosoma theileri]|uniref:Uncharacterized protein n=1 Tax=Trypanosoma theileri TaxID=67003 RepID=A0A1X0NNP5_9TRYP|nr:uncharacterized protein TM35_000301630 [Trypanosoma theileri]ORC86123.1 hypothetical protein TM35_000301630 [Trypanosoma theileri]
MRRYSHALSILHVRRRQILALYLETFSCGMRGNSDNSEDTRQEDASLAGDRRRLASHWEKAFFGRVHYEPGMREHYRSATEAEREEKEPQEGKDEMGLEYMSNRELFPNWAEDEEAPLHEFRQLPAALRRRYIANRLAMAERRVMFAADYGSLLMMQHLNLGERMLNEAEALLVECGWWNSVVAAKIEAVRDHAAKVKFEFDLD